MTMRETAAQNWAAYKPIGIALAVGLLVGPFISNYAGWQVTSSSARAQVHAGVVEQQASFCAARAQADVKDAAKLDYSARSDLAKKWAVAPGKTEAEYDVTSACASKLASL